MYKSSEVRSVRKSVVVSNVCQIYSSGKRVLPRTWLSKETFQAFGYNSNWPAKGHGSGGQPLEMVVGVEAFLHRIQTMNNPATRYGIGDSMV